MRTFLSYVGLIFLALGLLMLGGDMMSSLEQGQIGWHSFQSIWSMFDAGSVHAFQAWTSRTLPSFVAGAVQTILGLPALSLGIFGVIIAFFAGHKHDED
jgi:hypothetical protein